MLKRLPKILFTTLLPCLLFFVNSCKTKDVSKTKEENSVNINQKLVQKKLYNQDSTLLLVMKYEQSLENVKNINFRVIEVSTKKEFLSSVFNGTKLEWNDKKSLKGYLPVGIIEQEVGNPDNVKNNTNPIKIIKINY